MKLCMSSISSKFGHLPSSALSECKFALESFYYVKPEMMNYFMSRQFFIMDSGAFTFLSSGSSKVDWDKYVQNYVAFINQYDVKLFFEMDIDKIVGLSRVEKYRDFIERETGKKCIPVWHKSRGLQYWKDLCAGYGYVAIGGIAIKDIAPAQFKYFHEFIKTADNYQTKVHALGFTGKDVSKYGFYSVDSSTWASGGRYGSLYIFNGERMNTIHPSGRRAKSYHQIDEHNFLEWCKFQKYLERK